MYLTKNGIRLKKILLNEKGTLSVNGEDMTFTEFCEKVKISAPHLGSIFNGRRKATPAMFFKVKDFIKDFDVTWEHFNTQ